MVGGVLTAVVAMLFGLSSGASMWIGVAGGVVVIAALSAFAYMTIPREQARLTVLFPTPGADTVADSQA